MVFLYLPCSRWVYNDDMRYLTHYSQICFGRRTTLHGAIRGEKPRYDMQQSTMGTMIEWYHIFGLDWPYRDCMDTILIEDIKCTHDMHKMFCWIILQYKWCGSGWRSTIGVQKGCTNRFIAKNNVYWIAMCLYAKHNNICIENAWNHHITYFKTIHIAIK